MMPGNYIITERMIGGAAGNEENICKMKTTSIYQKQKIKARAL